MQLNHHLVNVHLCKIFGKILAKNLHGQDQKHKGLKEFTLKDKLQSDAGNQDYFNFL